MHSFSVYYYEKQNEKGGDSIEEDTALTVFLAVSTLSNVINANDNTGVYYCVRSTAGHQQIS